MLSETCCYGCYRRCVRRQSVPAPDYMKIRPHQQQIITIYLPRYIRFEIQHVERTTTAAESRFEAAGIRAGRTFISTYAKQRITAIRNVILYRRPVLHPHMR